MANLVCTLCEGEAAVVLFTDMANGDTTNVGPSCISGFALGLAAATTADMPPELAESYGAQFDQIAANDTRTKSPTANGAASGKTRAKSAPSTPTPPSEDSPRPDTQPSTASDVAEPLPF